MRHHAHLIFVFLVETGFHHVGQSGLELLNASDPPSRPPKVLRLQVGAIVPGPFADFLIGLFVFLLLSFMSSLYILITIPCQIYLLQIFHSLNSVFHRVEIFNFNEVQLINYFFQGLGL